MAQQRPEQHTRNLKTALPYSTHRALQCGSSGRAAAAQTAVSRAVGVAPAGMLAAAAAAGVAA